MKVRKVEIFWNKISPTCCNWSSLIAPGTETPVSHPLLGESLFPFQAPAASFLPLSGVIRNGSSQYEGQEGGTFVEQNQLNRLQMVHFERPRDTHPFVSRFIHFQVHLTPEFPFLFRGLPPHPRRSRPSASRPSGVQIIGEWNANCPLNNFGFLNCYLISCKHKFFLKLLY